QLTEAVRRRPYQVLLLDEFEKAHRDVQQAFLQVFDEGRMTDGRGRTVDFTNTVIVMTSNIGAAEAREAAESRAIGFSQKQASRSTAVKDAVMTAARNVLPPELYNRIDEVLFFQPLTRDEVREVARRQLDGLSRRLVEARGVEIAWSEEGIDVLLDRGGYDPSLGARPVKRAIARLVEAPLAEMLLREELRAGDVLHVGATDDGKVELSVQRS
ncbi:MAG: peptidase, partial [Deltaproteobacteria bacterium HGW-Deltaproteobacteria-20]